MTTDYRTPDEEKVIRAFCDRYEGRESEIGCQPILYGDLRILADKMNIPIEEIIAVLLQELKKLGE